MKFILECAVHSLRRHPGKSALSAAISAILLIFLLALFSSIEANRQQLESVQKTIPVNALITNENGGQTVGLRIPDEQMLKLEAFPGVKPVSSTAYLEAVLLGKSRADVRDVLTLAGANSLAASPVGGQNKRQISWQSGWNEAKFFSSRQAVCIVPEQFPARQGLKVGGKFSADVYDITYDKSSAQVPRLLGTADFRIAGSYSALPGEQVGVVVAPMDGLRTVCKGLGKDFYRDSTSVQLTTALSLNRFKDYLKKLGLNPIDTSKEPSRNGNSAVVYDRSFIQAAAPLQSSTHSLQRLEPLLLALAVLIGGLASFLLLQSRRAEIALHRSMGLRKREAFLLMFSESAVLCLFGCILGNAAMFFTTRLPAAAAEVTGVFFVCYMLGTTAALLLINRVSVLQILHAAE